jgi:hypothetical protein
MEENSLGLRERAGGVVRKLVLRLVTVAALGAALTGGRAHVAPAAPDVIAAPVALAEPAQFIYGGRPYCWYPYGWAGAGWYWCGYGTYVGVGWGGAYGWNGWAVPRHHRAARVTPPYRFRPEP